MTPRAILTERAEQEWPMPRRFVVLGNMSELRKSVELAALLNA
jgi:hypothetical protein